MEHNMLNYSYIQRGGARFDVLKFILAMCIVIMHSGLIPGWLIPITRLAVPLFFIMTSYFFHLKIGHATDDNTRRQLLWKYVKRNFQLYLFWSVLLLPTVIVLHLSWFRVGVTYAVLNILQRFFIIGFFPASWFILSTIYAVIVCFLLSKRLSNVIILIIAFLVYTLALLDSNYGGLLNEELRLTLSVSGIRHSLNFPAAFIWVVIGKIIAEKHIILPRKKLYPLLFLVSIMYGLEFLIIEHYGWSIHNDCYLTSLILCPMIFIAIGQSDDIRCKYSLLMRKSSIIIYCLHLTIVRLLNLYSSHVSHLSVWGICLITLLLCFIGSFIIIYLGEYKNVRILRKAY